MYNLDSEVNKLQRISQLINQTKMEDKKINKGVANQVATKVTQPITNNQKQDDEMEKKLKALKDKAGNLGAFEVSPLYKKSCASCHGNIGEGIIGPKLIGQSKEKILKALKDFKSGKRKNYVMYGLLNGLSESQLEELATEISTFKSKLEESQK
jgi:HPt (histidine-containing phosphotransfer) domain-containing protein